MGKYFASFERWAVLQTLFLNEQPSLRTGLIAAAALTAGICWLLYAQHRRAYLKSLPSHTQLPTKILSHIASRQELEDLNGNIDVAIVGSGLGSLCTAAVLCRCGYKVAVFEQHFVAGGSTHMYKTNGGEYEFDVGVHYIGNQLDSCWSPFRVMFDFLSDGCLKWTRISENYDVAYNYTTGERLDFTGDPVRNRESLLLHFSSTLKPSALDKYYRKCRYARIVATVCWALKCFPPAFTRLVWKIGFGNLYRKVCLVKTLDVMRDCGLPDDVIGAVTYSYGDYGTPPSQSPFFIQAYMENHYNGGAFFPVGGSTSIAKTLVAGIQRRGGKVFAATPVERILTEKNWWGNYSATGVCVRGTNILTRKGVVSGVGFTRTFEADETLHPPPLVSDARASAAQLRLIHPTESHGPFKLSHSFFYLFVGLNGTDQELHLPGQNIWHLKGWNHDELSQKLLESDSVLEALKEGPPLVFVSNESAKDPEYSIRHPGKSTVTMIAWTNPLWFRQWNETAHGKRGKEYEDIKAKMTDTLLEILHHHFPLTKGRVHFAELGTPLSTNKYLGRRSGEIYNLDHNVGRFESLGAQLALHPQTTIKNLYLAGQDVTAVSVEGATMSGFLAAGRISLFAMLFVCLPAFFPCLLGLLSL